MKASPAVQMLLASLEADTRTSDNKDVFEIKVYEPIDDYDCRAEVAYPSDNGRSSWADTRKRHNYRK